MRLAKLSVDRVVTAPCGPSVLYPKSGGNLHCFTAVTPCAVLDILAPPYDEAAGRRCTYYHDYPYSSFGVYFFLTSFSPAFSFTMGITRYRSILVIYFKIYSAGAGDEDAIVHGKEDEYAWLTATDTPDYLYMRSGRYMGPAIQTW